MDVASAPNRTAYAATYGYGLFRRAADDEAWSRITFDDNYFHSVFVDADGNVFVANDASGVLRSSDGGATWQPIGDGLEDTAASHDGCHLYDPFTGAHRRVYDLTRTAEGRYWAATDCGLYRSEPSLDGWTYVGLRAYDLRSIVVHPTGALLAGSRYDGLFVSRDDGSTWTRKTFDGDAETSIISGLVVDTRGHIYAGTNDLNVSTDAGATWQTVQGTGERFGYNAIVVGPEDGIYAATLNGLLYSEEGTHWTVLDDLPETGTREFATVQGLTFLSDGTALANLIHVGLARSDKRLQQWSLHNKGIEAVDVRGVTSGPDGTLYAFALQPDVAYRSLDGGQTWDPMDELTNESIDELFVDAGGTVYALSTFRLFRSTDRGETWTALNLRAGELQYGLSRGNTSYRLAATVTPQGVLLTGAGPGGVYRSEDGGTTWARRLPSLRATDITASAEAAFVMSTEGTVYQSNDAGKTWTRLSNTSLADAADTRPQRMMVIPGGGVLVTTLGGLYRLSSEGKWKRLEFAGRPVDAAYALDPRTILAAVYSDETEGDEVFLTVDGGDTWRNASSGFDGLTPDVHDFSRGSDGTVYMATRGGGVYRGIGPIAP